MEKTKEERVNQLSEMIRLSLMEISLMIPYLDLLEEMGKQCEESLTLATSGSIILEAMGKDSEEAENKATLELERVKALINLIKVLKKTEDNRQSFLKKKSERDKFSEQFERLFY